MQTRFYCSLKKNTLKLTLVLFLFSMALSCKKGDTGPVGATGAAGAAGSAGAAGAAGPAGAANVIYSDWFTPATYKKDTIFGSWGFNFDKADAAITQKILDSGVVITFGKLDGYNPVIWPTTQIAALPIIITYLSGATANIDTWSALVTAGNLRIRLVSSLNAYGGISNAHKFRYIIIPGGVKESASVSPSIVSGMGNKLNGTVSVSQLREVTQHFSEMSYAEICQRLGVPQ
ncbi:hypothetical protein ACX0G9_26595 [Flavitalea flava]